LHDTDSPTFGHRRAHDGDITIAGRKFFQV
jgi:hypothetical protein